MIIYLAFVEGKHVYWIENEISKWKINLRFYVMVQLLKYIFQVLTQTNDVDILSLLIF